jgi:hypothetical protein
MQTDTLENPDNDHLLSPCCRHYKVIKILFYALKWGTHLKRVSTQISFGISHSEAGV